MGIRLHSMVLHAKQILKVATAAEVPKGHFAIYPENARGHKEIYPSMAPFHHISFHYAPRAQNHLAHWAASVRLTMSRSLSRKLLLVENMKDLVHLLPQDSTLRLSFQGSH
ncbi:hypothetical protein HHK36_031227 [Tetracentron sinense]|uniref:Uncharacterized protein n=1 Tax=Tetracentron sinense TaxID=13715 RepID=A0A835CZ26_TETSI|nr:hypothetical protein HHK36_031227 [Tetracentron sinense]